MAGAVLPLPGTLSKDDGAADREARVQEQFVDRPDDAVHDADRLVTTLMSERGYPTED